MAIIVEDGTIVSGANSYISTEEAEAYIELNLQTIPADATLELYIIRAKDYLESKRNLYQGTKVSSTQPLQFPRYNVYIDGFLQSYEEIPSILKEAQNILVLAQVEGKNLFASNTFDINSNLKRTKVAGFEREYFEGKNSIYFYDERFDNMIRPLYKSNRAFLTRA